MNHWRRTPPAETPWALMARMRWQSVDNLRTVRVPERAIEYYRQNGWIVVARDSDVPLLLDVHQYWDDKLPAQMFSHPAQSQGDGYGDDAA